VFHVERRVEHGSGDQPPEDGVSKAGGTLVVAEAL
jgi:hypothetical protein